MLTCPVCLSPLALEGRTYRCRDAHAFDRAREGHVDLLPVGHGRSGLTGDTRSMTLARQRFLQAGHYDRLVRRVVDAVVDHVEERAGTGPRAVAEAGCGTGHYIGAIRDALPAGDHFGFDVSRAALRVAARAHPRVTFALADVNHRLPLPDASLVALLDIFAPRNANEFRRVLRPDGLLVVVIPADRHLAELRERLPLLGIEPEKRERTLEQLAPAFEPVWEDSLEWAADLAAPDVADLIGMTPSAFHLARADLAATGAARVTMAFRLLGLTPAPAPAH